MTHHSEAGSASNAASNQRSMTAVPTRRYAGVATSRVWSYREARAIGKKAVASSVWATRWYSSEVLLVADNWDRMKSCASAPRSLATST